MALAGSALDGHRGQVLGNDEWFHSLYREYHGASTSIIQLWIRSSLKFLPNVLLLLDRHFCSSPVTHAEIPHGGTM